VGRREEKIEEIGLSQEGLSKNMDFLTIFKLDRTARSLARSKKF